MTSIDIIAEFDFLPKGITIGRLDYERVKGDATFLFEYDMEFLHTFPGTVLSRDLGLYEGKQGTSGQIFSFLGDVLPDRWGRALIDKRERIVAAAKNRQPRKFDDFDYMVHLDDQTRMGALRFLHEGKLISANASDRDVPIVADLKEIIYESQAYERALIENKMPQDNWINNLWAQGSSLGGARPKANVRDNGELYIAKIPSVKDTYDVALWEHFALTLAKKAGINSAESRIIKLTTSDYHVLLSKRFDRVGDKRIHYASSLTLTGLKDGDGNQTGKGYLDIINAIVSDVNVCHPMDNIKELYRRIAFSILIGNHDDHFRNHGFLLTKNGWTLSPAFDINPSLSMAQSLMISESSNSSLLSDLLAASDSYLLEKRDAEEIVGQVKDAVSDWRQTAKNIGISETEQQRFAHRIDPFVKPQKIIYNTRRIKGITPNLK